MKTQWEHNVIMWKHLKTITTIASREMCHSCLSMSSGDLLVSIWRSTDTSACNILCRIYWWFVYWCSGKVLWRHVFTRLTNIQTSSQYTHLKLCYKHLIGFLMIVYFSKKLFTCLCKKSPHSERPNSTKSHLCDGLLKCWCPILLYCSLLSPHSFVLLHPTPQLCFRPLFWFLQLPACTLPIVGAFFKNKKAKELTDLENTE